MSFDKNLYEPSSRLSRSRKKSYEIGSNENISGSKPYYTRQTVASALRSRSPSPQMNKSMDYHEDLGTKDNAVSHEENEKPPFVIRKVPDSLITRAPKLHDTVRSTSRRGRSKRRQSPSKSKSLRSSTSIEKRFRSASPPRKSGEDYCTNVIFL